MNSKVEESQSSGVNTGMLALAGALVVLGLLAFYFFSDLGKLVRGGILLGSWAAAAAVVYFSNTGKALKEFFVEADFERRKVIWPTKDETWRTTIIIGIVVTIIGFILFLIDLLFKWAILEKLMGA